MTVQEAAILALLTFALGATSALLAAAAGARLTDHYAVKREGRAAARVVETQRRDRVRADEMARINETRRWLDKMVASAIALRRGELELGGQLAREMDQYGRVSLGYINDAVAYRKVLHVMRAAATLPEIADASVSARLVLDTQERRLLNDDPITTLGPEVRADLEAASEFLGQRVAESDPEHRRSGHQLPDAP